MKVESGILLQTDINSINNDWNSTEQAKMPYFHCGPSNQNKNERKG